MAFYLKIPKYLFHKNWDSLSYNHSTDYQLQEIDHWYSF